MPRVIDEFRGEYRFLSNFWRATIGHDGIIYPSVEHAYQASKTLNFLHRKVISNQETPGKAKREGRKVILRPDWEQVKRAVMWELVLQKFARHANLRKLLLATEDALLVEGNTWGDTYWGVCRGKGANNLGRILMGVRAVLSQ